MSEPCIGVFDSGLGGLTAVKQLLLLAPDENIVYFGDTARVPYGVRSAETITRYAKQDIAFLLRHGVKLLIDACGTMSSVLTRDYTCRLPVPYIDVLNPAAKAAAAATKNKKIGVIATPATVKSDAFRRALSALDQEIEVFSQACPLFVPLVENGYVEADNPVTALVAKEYLLPLRARGIDTLILGCTHYPLIAPAIGAVMGDGVRLIDSGYEAARAAVGERTPGRPDRAGSLVFFTSDNPPGFSRIASMFLGRDLSGMVGQADIESVPPYEPA